jgi:hypothetical protein
MFRPIEYAEALALLDTADSLGLKNCALRAQALVSQAFNVRSPYEARIA